MSGKFYRYGIAALVMVLALVMAQGALAQGSDAGRIEIVGNIEAMDMNTLTVNGLTVDITTAQINTALEIDAAVQVEGVLLMDMSIRATEVNAANMGLLPGEVEFTGVVDAMAADTIVVAGLEFDITTAEVGADVAPGALVKVHASQSDTGVWVAREVFVAPPAPPTAPDATPGAPAADTTPTAPAGAVELEIIGTLEQVTDGAIVVSGQTIDITGAEIKDTLIVGTLVKVELYMLNGQPVAREVENARQRAAGDDTGEEFEIVGMLEEVGDGFIVVDGQMIDITGAEINDPLAVGMMVKVHLRMMDGQAVAREVEREDNDNINGNDNTAVVVPQDCVPAMPAGWTTYTVQPGDTLFGLASRTGSSMSELALVNCITDSRFIVAGADLFVPRTPAPAFVGNGNGNFNDNNDDGSFNDNSDDHGNDNSDDHGNDNSDDHGNDNSDDHGGSDSEDHSGSGGGDHDDD